MCEICEAAAKLGNQLNPPAFFIKPSSTVIDLLKHAALFGDQGDTMAIGITLGDLPAVITVSVGAPACKKILRKKPAARMDIYGDVMSQTDAIGPLVESLQAEEELQRMFDKAVDASAEMPTFGPNDPNVTGSKAFSIKEDENGVPGLYFPGESADRVVNAIGSFSPDTANGPMA
jgi:hypothetical protein